MLQRWIVPAKANQNKFNSGTEHSRRPILLDLPRLHTLSDDGILRSRGRHGMSGNRELDEKG
jgi:hypothetical protein